MKFSDSTLEKILDKLQIEDDNQQEDYRLLDGGDINSAARFSLADQNYFVKWNDADRYPLMFEAEAKGLNELRKANCIRIPEVKFIGEQDGGSFLLLELIDEGSRRTKYFQEFGEQLAQLHQNTKATFGLDHRNYIGSLPQVNTPTDTWSEFFVVNRLEEQIRLARDNRQVDAYLSNGFKHLFNKIESLFPNEAPALLHGDLWSGNQMPDKNGKPCIYDPAVYYGHREMDIAMTKLFGGFSTSFYESYNQAYALEEGWEQRVDLCNLYPLLVHVNLFGGGYAEQVRGILKYFT